MVRHPGVWLLGFGLWALAGMGLSHAQAGEGGKPPTTLGQPEEAAFFEQLAADLDQSVFEVPQELTEVLRKYYRRSGSDRSLLLNGLRRGDRERRIHTLTLIALLRLSEFVHPSRALTRDEPGDASLQEGVAFFLHRVGQAPVQNLERMVRRLPALIEKPTDDWVILWLGFVDTPEPARSFLQKLGGDGAVGELVRVARMWLDLRCPEQPAISACKKDPWLARKRPRS